MRWWSLLVLLPAVAQAQPEIRADNPHEYGWLLGDELVQRIEIELPAGVTFDRASLPRPRAVDYWLDLRSIDLQEAAGHAELTLHWQNFYSALAPDRREVPPSPVRLSDGTEMNLPGFVFVAAPLRPITDQSSPAQLLPDPPFRLIQTGRDNAALAISAAIFLCVLIAIGWTQAWWPFHRRPARPFTRAARSIARLREPALQRRALHRALDAAFNRVLISADLPQFLVARPEYQPLADRLDGFFRASDAAFFGTREAPDVSVVALSRDLARIERGLR